LPPSSLITLGRILKMEDFKQMAVNDDSAFRLWVVQTLTALQTQTHMSIVAQDQRNLDHEARLRLVEKKIWTATGAASVLSSLVTSAFIYITKKLGANG